MTNEQLAVKCKSDDRYIPELWEAVYKLICLWSVKYLPKTGATSQYEMEDLIQSGYFALLQAVNDYPEDSPYKFSTFLYHHCRNEFREVLGIRSNKKARPPAMSLDMSLTSEDGFTLLDTLEDSGAAESFADVEDKIYYEQLSEALHKALDTIPDNQREVVQGRYMENKTLREIALEKGVYPETIRQAENKALRSLRKGKAYRILKDFDYRSEGLKGTGLNKFKATGTSSVEAAILRMVALHGE